MSLAAELTAELAEAVESILKATSVTPSKIHATFIYVQNDLDYDLVPDIEIEWQKK
jgi:hypothetical protein